MTDHVVAAVVNAVSILFVGDWASPDPFVLAPNRRLPGARPEVTLQSILRGLAAICLIRSEAPD